MAPSAAGQPIRLHQSHCWHQQQGHMGLLLVATQVHQLTSNLMTLVTWRTQGSSSLL